VLWFLVFFGFAVNYMIRINMNIAIVDMVQHLTHKTEKVEKTYYCMADDLPISHNRTTADNVGTKNVLSLEQQLLNMFEVRYLVGIAMHKQLNFRQTIGH
jgi:hypothetical protein